MNLGGFVYFSMSRIEGQPPKSLYNLTEYWSYLINKYLA